jgi:hypothetical protein
VGHSPTLANRKGEQHTYLKPKDNKHQEEWPFLGATGEKRSVTEEKCLYTFQGALDGKWEEKKPHL